MNFIVENTEMQKKEKTSDSKTEISHKVFIKMCKYIMQIKQNV